MTAMTGVLALVTIEVAVPFQHAPTAAGMRLRRTPTTEVKFRGRSPPPNFSPKENHRQIEWMRNAKANAKPQAGLVRDRVTPVSQYAGALWKNIGRVRALFPTSGRLAITVPRYYRDIMVAQRASFRRGAPKSSMLGVFAASRLAYASIVPHH